MDQTKTMEELINHWIFLQKEKKEKEASDWYWQKLWPYVLKSFLAKSAPYTGKFDVLISLVGFSPEPVILTILALKPKEVKFIISEETKPILDIIVQKTGLKPSQFDSLTVASSNIEDVYEAIRNSVRDKDLGKVAIDITGGKKSMVGGAAQAAGYLGCAAFYVDYSEYNKAFRKPTPGSEYLNFLRNPYEIFGELELDRAMELYRAGDYSAALEILSRLLSRAPEIKAARIKKEIFAMHQAWESYLFEKAKKHAKEALKWIDTYHQYTNLIECLQDKIDVLDKILNQESQWIVLNHYAMALQFAKRLKYDFAIMLLYRTLELIIAYRLNKEYQLDVNNPDYSKFPDMLKHYNRLLPEIYEKRAKLQKNLPLKVGLMAGISLLAILDDLLVKDISLKDIRMQADNRNKGILAHGLKPNTKKQFEAMNRHFQVIIKRFLKFYFPEQTFDNLLNRFQPVNF